MATISRYDKRYFILVGEDKSPLWAPVGEGFLKFEEKKNAQTVYRRYYHEESLRGETDGYSSEIVYEAELVKGSAALEKIYEMANDELCGKYCVVKIMAVDYFSEELPGAYSATVRDYSVCPDKCYGDASEAMQEDYRLIKAGWDEGSIYLADEFNSYLKWNSLSLTYWDSFIDNPDFEENAGLLDKIRTALDEAYQAANDTQKARIRRALDVYNNAEAYFIG